MKKNIMMIVILIALFFFGVLIYDFSDELTEEIANNEWYTVQETGLTVVSFKNNKFSYLLAATNKPLAGYEKCKNYRFNNSINVVKLNCSTKAHKLYITSSDDEKLVISIDGDEKTFYNSKEAALVAAFQVENNLTAEELNKLLSVDLSKFTGTTVSAVNTLYKGKTTKLVAFVSGGAGLKNALNLNGLETLADNSIHELVVLNSEKLTTAELKKLNKLNKSIPTKPEELSSNTIMVYAVGKKKCKLIATIDVNSLSEINNYNNV